MSRTAACSTLALCILLSGCASSFRPHELARLEQIQSEGIKPELESKKNPWIAGFLGLAAPACNVYLAYGTGRNEQLPMAALNLITWPFSVAWAIPGCVLDTQTVNRLSYLVEHPAELEKAAR
ncbi:MAG: hypothetical protein AB8G23_05725 [Myxococcota bacterium]